MREECFSYAIKLIYTLNRISMSIQASYFMKCLT
jgi:hypothetical protein